MHLRKATSRFRQVVQGASSTSRPISGARPPSRHSTVDTIRVANRPGIGHTPPLLMHSHQLLFLGRCYCRHHHLTFRPYNRAWQKPAHHSSPHLPIPFPPDTLLTYVGSQRPTLFLLWPSPAKHPYCWPLLESSFSTIFAFTVDTILVLLY